MAACMYLCDLVVGGNQLMHSQQDITLLLQAHVPIKTVQENRPEMMCA